MSDVDVGVTRESRPVIFRCDWACPTCGRYGFVRVEVTGGPRNPRTGKPHPKTSDEEFYRKVDEAHREATAGICVADTRHILIGPVLWRWQRTTRGKEFIIRVPDGVPQMREYRWPPARPPWVPR